jgi:signal transduction histidine kinase/CheY-like chemotaxis protein
VSFTLRILRLWIVVSITLQSVFAAEVTNKSVRIPKQYSITSANDFPDRDPRDWRLLGSTNLGKTWVALDFQTNQIFQERFETKTFPIASAPDCNAFRLEVLRVRDLASANSMQLAEIALNGILDGKEGADLRPQPSDPVTAQGEYAPVETRRMAFDGNLRTKWLDFNAGPNAPNGTGSSWIEWHYGLPPDGNLNAMPVITRVADLYLKARQAGRELVQLNLKAAVHWKSPTNNCVLLHDSSGAALVTFRMDWDNLERSAELEITGQTLISREGATVALSEAELKIQKVGTRPIAPLPRVSAGEILRREEEFRWVEASGEVTFVGKGQDGWELVLQSHSGTMRILLATPVDLVPQYLLQSRVRVRGVCIPTLDVDESRVAGELITPNLEHVRVMAIGPEHWRGIPVSSLADHLKGAPVKTVRLRGHLSEKDGVNYFKDSADSVRFSSGAIIEPGKHLHVEVIGRLAWVGSERVLTLAGWREVGLTEGHVPSLPLLTALEQVHGLARNEAELGYPVKVRGVVTCVLSGSAGGVIQDGTRGVYVPNLTSAPERPPEVGDFVEVEGRTDPGDFAPIIVSERVSPVTKGALPEPLLPTWAQLMNGSMDSQYVELRGVVSSINREFISLLTRGGRLKIGLENFSPETLPQYENSIVRIRGCLLAGWDDKTRRVVPGEIRMSTVAISVERAAPQDDFSVLSKRAEDLLLFDALADDLQRIKISGQILHERSGVYFMADGNTGIRIAPQKAFHFVPGDLAEVVGFPRAEGPAVVLREARVRQAGHRALPEPKEIGEADLSDPENDARRVRMLARLTSIRADRSETILELQVGPRNVQGFVKEGGHVPASLSIGSLLEITGVFAGRGSADQRRVESFELLIDSFRDIRIAQHAPWWTARHTLAVLAATMGTLLGAAAWIRGLRREVERKTATLKNEIEVRRHAEEVAQRARLEAEAGSRAKSQFLATMSHEIRTPMNGILGMTSLLLDAGLTREQRELAQTANASGEALLAIMNEMLDFSKIEAGKLSLDASEFNLCELVEVTVDLVAERAQRKNLELNYWIAEDLPVQVRGDAGRFRQILLNLLGNAVKFTESGEVFLEINGEARSDGKVKLKVTVADTGIGIPPDVQSRLFAPFEQADQSTTRRYGGTGLGLAICKRLAELMGGTIGVTSKSGEGSTFWFTVVLEKSVPAGCTAVVEDSERLAGIHVLIVGDKPRSSEILRRFAERWKMQARAEANLARIREFLASRVKDKSPVLILIDGDLSVANELRREFASSALRVALLAPLHHRPSVSDLAEARVTMCLTKPPRKNQLCQSLLELIQPNVDVPERGLKPVPEPVERKSTRILLAEDNAVNQHVALRQLKRLGYSADVVTNGVEVLEAVARSRYDVILMDCQMPEMDGYEATKRIRDSSNNLGRIRIIAMTANAMQGDRERCLEAGMDDYISKPVNIEKLRATLERQEALYSDERQAVEALS